MVKKKILPLLLLVLLSACGDKYLTISKIGDQPVDPMALTLDGSQWGMAIMIPERANGPTHGKSTREKGSSRMIWERAAAAVPTPMNQRQCVSWTSTSIHVIIRNTILNKKNCKVIEISASGNLKYEIYFN